MGLKAATSKLSWCLSSYASYLFKKIQLIQNNNAYHKILSKGTAQMMSNILVHPPMNG